MHQKILMIVAIAMIYGACQPGQKHDEASAGNHEEAKIQYTIYSDHFELFAEADAFVAGEPANILSHISELPGFKGVEFGKITVVLETGGQETRQTLEEPTRKGIYSFDFTPVVPGKGQLKFEIVNEAGNFEVVVPEVTVFSNREEAHKAADTSVISRASTAVFTKEQSWKIDFSTGHPEIQSFGPVIKTVGMVQPAPGSEVIVTAKTSGVVLFSANAPFEGTEVTSGQILFSISGSEFADDNSSVRYTEAKNNYEKAKADFERSKTLAEERIISEKDLLIARTEYENAKVVFENLSKNFNASGQVVKSPIDGFIRVIKVRNGSYVSAGEPVLTISQNRTLVISAEVPQKYASMLSSIQTANIRNPQDDRTWTLDELGGKILSFGKATGEGSYLIPVTLSIRSAGNFIPGGLVELYLKTVTSNTALTVPNAAILEEQGIFFVWVQVTPELFEKREVTVGKTDGLNTEILDRLSISERIVTRGALMVKLAQATGTLDAHSGHVH